MDQIKVDIRLRVLARDHDVFMSRPGRGYRLYSEVVESKMILLELPHLQLRPDVPLSEHIDLVARIKRARKLRQWHNLNRPADKEPSRNLSDYDNKSIDQSTAQYLGMLRGFFERADKGDLVLVPPSAFSVDAYIGEIADNKTDYPTHRSPRYGRDLLTGRKVRWLAHVPKRRLSTAILDIVQKPSVFVLLPREVRDELYEMAYGSYSFGDAYHVRFDVTSEGFRTSDDFLIQAFVNFVAANTRAIQRGADADVKGIKEAAFIDLGDFAPLLRTNVNSPGTLTIGSHSISPIVAAVLFALAITVGSTAFTAAQEGKIVIGNSKAPANDPCTTEVRNQVYKHLQLLGLDEWAEACEKARRAAERTGLKGQTNVIEK